MQRPRTDLPTIMQRFRDHRGRRPAGGNAWAQSLANPIADTLSLNRPAQRWFDEPGAPDFSPRRVGEFRTARFDDNLGKCFREIDSEITSDSRLVHPGHWF